MLRLDEIKIEHKKYTVLRKYNISVDFVRHCARIIVRRKGGIVMNVNEILGSRIKALRSAKNFTQEQIADKIGISRQKSARIESGVNSITLDILSEITEVLGVTIGDITKVLDESPAAEYRAGEENGSSKKIFDMLDLFYANKHMYEKLR